MDNQKTGNTYQGEADEGVATFIPETPEERAERVAYDRQRTIQGFAERFTSEEIRFQQAWVSFASGSRFWNEVLTLHNEIMAARKGQSNGDVQSAALPQVS